MNEYIPPARPLIGEDERAAVDKVLLSGMIAQGPEVAALNESSPNISSPTAQSSLWKLLEPRLHLGLLAAGIGPGDEVIVPSFTFAATANSVALTGATPVFVDIEPSTYTLDHEAVEAAISTRTAAIVPYTYATQPI